MNGPTPSMAPGHHAPNRIYANPIERPQRLFSLPVIILLSLFLGSALQAQQSKELYPIDDAYLEGTRRYNDGHLKVEKDSRIAYLKFDLSGINGTLGVPCRPNRARSCTPLTMPIWRARAGTTTAI